jgi:hypothetical protein
VRYLPSREPHLSRGQELGAFQLGSTVVLLTTRRAGIEMTAPPASVVRVGEAIARGASPRADRGRA